MALVNVVNMVVLDNPCNFANPFQFEITFECLQALEDDLEWKVLYVGSAHDAGKDQILEEILVGPVPMGINKFVLQADAPLPQQLPADEILGVTVVLVTCSYKEREFVRVGYYVNNELLGHDPEHPPPVYPQLDMTKVQRQILADKPRVTKFPIQWDDSAAVAATNDATAQDDSNNMQDTSMMQEDDDDDDDEEGNNNIENQHGQPPNVLPSDPVEAKMAAAMDATRRGALASTANSGSGADTGMQMD